MEFEWLKYDTDKIKGHGYQDIYTKYLDRNKKVIVELGSRNGSANLWCDYFQDGKIYGCDLIEFNIFNDRFEFIKLDMNNPKDYNKLPDNIDVVIEDGPHTTKSQMIFLNSILPKMNKGGVIIFEDLHCTEIGNQSEKEYLKFVGDCEISLNGMLKEWKRKEYNQYKYINGKDFQYIKKQIHLERGNEIRWKQPGIMKKPSEVIVIEVEK